MSKVLIAYATRSGNTGKIAELIAEGIRLTGLQAKVVNTNEIKNEKDLAEYDGLILGSATYNGEMMNKMKQILFLCEKVDLKDRVGGSFGAFGWSGEALERIYETMKNVFNMDMFKEPLRLKSPSLKEGKKMAQDYGNDIGQKLLSREQRD